MLLARPSRPETTLPPELRGRWQQVLPDGQVTLVAFGDDGVYYAVAPFAPVVFGPDAATMTVGPDAYTRIYGTGETVQGVWRDDSTGAEHFYRANGTFNIGAPDAVEISGTYVERNGEVETAEARAAVSVDGAALIFDVLLGDQVRMPFTLRSDVLTLGDAILTRVPALIYKIFRAEEWQQLRTDGTTAGAPIDVTDGFIHFSTATQAAETAAKHFAGQDDLFLIAVETAPLGAALRWELSRGDAYFPHLYRPMAIADVHWAQPLPLAAGTHQFPAGAGFD
ncbi:MAG: DUF952 domain-containing protein [Pseudomonadota bacterium]